MGIFEQISESIATLGQQVYQNGYSGILSGGIINATNLNDQLEVPNVYNPFSEKERDPNNPYYDKDGVPYWGTNENPDYRNGDLKTPMDELYGDIPEPTPDGPPDHPGAGFKPDYMPYVPEPEYFDPGVIVGSAMEDVPMAMEPEAIPEYTPEPPPPDHPGAGFKPDYMPEKPVDTGVYDPWADIVPVVIAGVGGAVTGKGNGGGETVNPNTGLKPSEEWWYQDTAVNPTLGKGNAPVTVTAPRDGTNTDALTKLAGFADRMYDPYQMKGIENFFGSMAAYYTRRRSKKRKKHRRRH